LRPRVDAYWADEVADSTQYVPGYVADCPVWRERDAAHPPVAVFSNHLVAVEVQGDDQRTRSVRCWQWQGLPPAGAEPQRGVLELGLGRGQGDRQLSEQLGMGVQGVAGGTPRSVCECWPFGGHAARLAMLKAARGLTAERVAAEDRIG
jgi:hypothetical protein